MCYCTPNKRTPVCANCAQWLAEENAKLREQLAFQTKQGADRLVGLCKCGLEREEWKQRAEAAEAKLKVASEQGLRDKDELWKWYTDWHVARYKWEPKPDIFASERNHSWSAVLACYEQMQSFAAPIPPVDVQQLEAELDAMNANYQALLPLYKEAQKRIAELERTLAEQQAAVKYAIEVAEKYLAGGYDGHKDDACLHISNRLTNAHSFELNNIIAKAREEGRNEASLQMEEQALTKSYREGIEYGKELGRLSAVPREVNSAPSESTLEEAQAFVRGFNACRDAMLAAAPTPEVKP